MDGEEKKIPKAPPTTNQSSSWDHYSKKSPKPRQEVVKEAGKSSSKPVSALENVHRNSYISVKRFDFMKKHFLIYA